MTTKIICGVLDKKVGIDQIFTQPNKGVVLRGWAGTCNDTNPQNMINKYPEDYALVKLGEIEMETGKITPKIETIAEAADFIIKEEN